MSAFLLIFIILYAIANLVFPMVYLEASGFERRLNRKCLTRLDYLLMIIFFPMTIMIGALFNIAKYSGTLIGKIAKKNFTKKLWHWLNASPSQEKREKKKYD